MISTRKDYLVSSLNTPVYCHQAQTLHVHTIVGETVPEDTEMNFTYLLFYKPILGTTLKVDFIFVVTYNNELFLEVHAHLLEAIFLY